MQQKLLDNTLTLGVDSFYEQAQHLIDEGQFGAPIILTPFNYRYGLIGGVEFTANYYSQQFCRLSSIPRGRPLTARTWSRRSSTFPRTHLDYIATNYIHLDHEGRVSASGGVSYLWLGTRFSVDGDTRYRIARTISLFPTAATFRTEITLRAIPRSILA